LKSITNSFLKCLRCNLNALFRKRILHTLLSSIYIYIYTEHLERVNLDWRRWGIKQKDVGVDMHAVEFDTHISRPSLEFYSEEFCILKKTNQNIRI